jgi:hypothetical protein
MRCFKRRYIGKREKGRIEKKKEIVLLQERGGEESAMNVTCTF